MNILFMTRKGEGLVGAPATYHGFEMAVGEQAECQWAGKGWELHKEGERLNDTVRRVMPDADWVIVDKNEFKPVPKKKTYKTGVMLSDLHAKWSHNINNPMGFIKLINSCNYNAVFMKYLRIHGCGVSHNVFLKGLEAQAYHLPWSIDPAEYHPKKKDIDAAFIGAHGATYPLRSSMWKGILYAGRGYKVVRAQSPKGKTFERDADRLKTEHYVGEKYADVLGRTKMMLFGSSKYRYFVQKYVEAGMSGCCILSDAPADARRLGFVPNYSFVEVNEYDWEENLMYLLENPLEAQKIGRNCLNACRSMHTHEVRAKEFIHMLRDHNDKESKTEVQ